MIRIAACLFAAVLVACCSSVLAADGSTLNREVPGIAWADLLPGAVFSPDIPGPYDGPGLLPGVRPLRSEEVLAYFRLLADRSPRARLVEYGRSHEGRPLFYLAVGEEGVIADLAGFQAGHARLMDPRGKKPGEGVGPETRAVAWMAYGIHGDELSSSDAAACLAYWLVTGADEKSAELRRSLLILIDPCENPDGRARYLAQIESFAHATANPDQDDLSHAGVWPWGRGNHYLFDLNRDWFTMVHPESQRSRTIAGWLPQMLVDSHEMGSDATYLFPPPRHPHNPLLPQSARKWERPFSDDQAAALDRRGYPYFTGEWNEEFFPGYGSSWASYLGAVGILYEMSRTTGTLVTKRDGTVRTFAQAIEHQVTSSVANLTSLARNREAVLTDMIAARAEAVRAGREGWIRAWVFPADGRNGRRLNTLAERLVAQGIEVQVLAEATRAGGLRSITDGQTRQLDLTVGSLLVRLDQPNAALARAVLDPHVPMDTVFFQDEREYLEKGKGSRLYDTTAWSIILGLGLDAGWTDRLPGGTWRPWALAAEPAPAVIPATYNSVIIPAGDRTGPVGVRLMAAGVTVRTARKPFRIGGRDFGPGALVVRREGNPADLHERLLAVQRDLGVSMHAVSTSRAEDGPDLGGAEYPVLVSPRVGVLSGSPVAPSSFGFVWHLLDQELGLRFNNLDVGYFHRADLSRYNVLVFPPVRGGEGAYRHLLGERGLSRLREWIEAGGTAIGLGGGARFLASPQTELTRARFRRDALEAFPPPVWSISAEEAERAGRPAATGLRIPGKGKDDPPPPAGHGSLYDVAPILGPGAVPFAAGHDQGRALGTQPTGLADWLKPVLSAEGGKPGPEDLARADERLRRFMPQGALLTVELDPEMWLGYGLGERISVWLGSDDTIVAPPPVEVAGRFADVGGLHRGGLLWPEAAARIALTGYATREAVGRGQVILFADHPLYRRWMKDTERIFTNAVLLGPGLGTRWSSPW